MVLEFDGQVAVVTGAGRGLGRAHALMLASRGCRVVVNDLGGGVTGGGVVDDGGLRIGFKRAVQELAPGAGPADKVVAEIQAGGGEAVASYDSVEDGAAIIQAAITAFGTVDIVVCNAGIVRTKYFGDYDDKDWHTLINVHLHGTFSVVRAAWPHFQAQRYGRVVLTSSSAGLYGQNLQAGYGAAKAAMMGLARVLSVEGKRHHISTNVVAPAATTRIASTENLEVKRGPDAGKSLPPPTTAFAPEYVSALVTYLCHASCDASGTFYHAGGGWYGKVELLQASGLVLGEEALRDPSKASPEAVAAGFGQVCDLGAVGAQINGPGNQALGDALTRALKALPKL
jgi:NAD(P)-dependent dehydrogenase (short-subunit alcohol dehydrogenase family)